MFRRVSSTLIATYDTEQYYALNTIVVVTLKKDNIDLKYILALLNSKLYNYIYSKKFKSTKKVFSEIQARSIGELPVKRNNLLEADISRIVDKILEKKKNDIQADISDLEKQIDKIVYSIYELDSDGIAKVEEEV